MANDLNNRKYYINLQRQFSLWPIVLTLVALVWVCLGLNHFAASREIPDLYCESELFFQPSVSGVKESLQDGMSLKLRQTSKLLTMELSHDDEQLLLAFKYVQDNKLMGHITFDGRLLGQEITSMTYKLLLNKQHVDLMSDRSRLPKEIQGLIDSEPSMHRKPQQLPIDLQMLEFNPETGHGIIQLKPSNNLWGCQLSA